MVLRSKIVIFTVRKPINKLANQVQCYDNSNKFWYLFGWINLIMDKFDVIFTLLRASTPHVVV